LKEQKRIAIGIFAALILILLTFSLAFKQKVMVNQLSLLKSCGLTIIASNNTYNTTIYEAITQAEQEQGYMNVSIVGKNVECKNNCGMLFPFNTPQESCFWMKDTEFQIKQIWLNESGGEARVVYIENASPYSTNIVCAYGNAVLELPMNYTISNLSVSKIGYNALFYFKNC